MFEYERASEAVGRQARGPQTATGPSGLLHLQMLAGNRAVTAALTTVVQRCGPDNPGCGCTPEEEEEKLRALAVQRMAPCPSAHPGATPPGWKQYFGNSSIFHCGYRGILEDRIPSPEDPQNECFYDNNGTLVDENHPHAGCRGTPNQYDSASSPISHFARDAGGILHSGWGAFWASRGHDLSAVTTDPLKCAQACQGVPDPRCMGTCMSQQP